MCANPKDKHFFNCRDKRKGQRIWRTIKMQYEIIEFLVATHRGNPIGAEKKLFNILSAMPCSWFMN